MEGEVSPSNTLKCKGRFNSPIHIIECYSTFISSCSQQTKGQAFTGIQYKYVVMLTGYILMVLKD